MALASSVLMSDYPNGSEKGLCMFDTLDVQHVPRGESLDTLPTMLSCLTSPSYTCSLLEHIAFNNSTFAAAIVMNNMPHIWARSPPDIDIILNAPLAAAASTYRHV